MVSMIRTFTNQRLHSGFQTINYLTMKPTPNTTPFRDEVPPSLSMYQLHKIPIPPQETQNTPLKNRHDKVIGSIIKYDLYTTDTYVKSHPLDQGGWKR